MNDMVVTGYSQDQINLLTKTIAPGLSADELKLFLHNCQRTGLDPFAKQIYAVKRSGKMCIQTGIDGFRLIAERTGKYAPGRDTEFLFDEKGNLTGAKVFVKKMTPDGVWHEVSATAFMREYSTGQNLWSKMPCVMIEKAAESRALRRCFPAEMGAIYEEAEMDQATPKAEAISPIEICSLTINDIQAEELRQMIGKNADLMKRFLQFLLHHFKIDKFEDIPLEMYPKLKADIIRSLNSENSK